MSIIIDVDATEVLAALDAVVDTIAARTKAASRVTADRVDAEATGRVARRTGETAEGITVEETHDGTGYVVFVRTETPGLGRYLEYGTRYMTKRPFLFASAHLEVGPHERRISEATQEGIDDVGLGE